MTKKEWQAKHGLTDDEMDTLQAILDVFKGNPADVKVFDKPFRERFKRKVVDLS